MVGRDQGMKSLIGYGREQLGFMLKDNSKPLKDFFIKTNFETILN